MSNYFTTAKVKVQKRSGFNKSHYSAWTAPVGTLVPIMTDELIPNTKVNLSLNLAATLPPLASDTLMKCWYKVEAFFVPKRLLYGGFENWLTNQEVYGYDPASAEAGALKNYDAYPLPPVQLYSGGSYRGTLVDYFDVDPEFAADVDLNPEPFFAYHRIWNDWYRNARVQPSIFYPYASGGRSLDWTAEGSLGWLPYITLCSENSPGAFEGDSTAFLDGVKLIDLRQRNFGADIFTTATSSPQAGDAQTVRITNSQFTISALRQANALQQFEERNNIASPRLQDYVKVNYGADLSSGVAQRAVLLGSASFDAYNKGIDQTSGASAQIVTQNPFKTVGAEYGRATASGGSLLVKGFTAQEPGYLMVIGSLVPKVTYSTGIDPMMLRYVESGSQTDMANPILQGVGNEPIYTEVLSSDSAGEIFGYVERYAFWKTKQDKVRGLFRDGESLSSFIAQRAIGGTPQIGTAFLKIPTNYLDDVAAVAGYVTKYGVQCEATFDYKVSMPLSAYTIPSLENVSIAHGDTVTVKRDGSHL